MDFSSFRTFFLGKQDKSNRESAMFFYGPDLLSIKWRNFKVHFSVRERPRGDVRMPGQQEVTSYSVEPTYSLGLRCCERPQEAVEHRPVQHLGG
jgi:hypothetical protein